MNNKENRMKCTISLLSIDRIAKKQVLTNRKEFKQDINTFRLAINHYREVIKGNPFASQSLLEHNILDGLDMLMERYKIGAIVITHILQIDNRFFSQLRTKNNRNKKKCTPQSLLIDRLFYINQIKVGLLTVKEVSVLAKVTLDCVYKWLKVDKQYNLTLDKAIAFRHDTI